MTMPIHLQNKWLFIHIPKTGGTSIEKMLGMYGRSEHNPLWSGLDDFGREQQHWTHGEVQTWADVEGLDLSGFFTFTFVRNPWDRLVSEWAWRRKYDLADTAFEAFIEVACEEHTHSHVRPQSDFFAPLQIDFVGRYERFERDVAELLTVLGERPRAVPHVQCTEHDPYPAYYDDKTRARVAEAYSRDVKRFGYSFEAPIVLEH